MHAKAALMTGEDFLPIVCDRAGYKYAPICRQEGMQGVAVSIFTPYG